MKIKKWDSVLAGLAAISILFISVFIWGTVNGYECEKFGTEGVFMMLVVVALAFLSLL